MRPVVVLSVDPDTRELEGLVEAWGGLVVEIVIQRRTAADPSTFVGSGKAEELAALFADTHPPISDADPEKAGWLVVANAELRPSQLFNLEDILHVEVWDRIRLILEIFQAKAQVKEARLQVELARLRYELPYVHEAVHRRRTGERPGFMGGGEYEIRTYETHLKRRVKKIQGELERVRGERRSRRAGRRRSGFRLAAITGYTNAGKSRLLNALCADEAVVEERFFSTLQTRTRRLRREYADTVGGPLLFTDTVGFIEGLPPWLVNAFSATLEETVFADVILLVVDIAEPADVAAGKMHTALEILDEIGASKRVMILLNKIDKLGQEQGQTRIDRLRVEPALTRHPWTVVSGRTGEGLKEALVRIWKEILPTRDVTVIIELARPGHLSFESWLHDHTQVQKSHDQDAQRIIEVECSEEQYGNLLREASKSGVETRSAGSSGNQGGPLGQG